MSPRTWMVVGCIADFLIACGGAVSGAMAQAGGVVMPSRAVWLLGGILGTVAVANHLKAAYNPPPGGPTGGAGGVGIAVLAALGWALGWLVA